VDQFELLAAQDDEFVFREIFDFERPHPVSSLEAVPESPSATRNMKTGFGTFAGDRRAEDEERLDPEMSTIHDAKATTNISDSPMVRTKSRKSVRGLTDATDEDKEVSSFPLIVKFGDVTR
jgi:hypothetical protein